MADIEIDEVERVSRNHGDEKLTIQHANTTQNIAYFLIGVFSAALFILLIVAWRLFETSPDVTASDKWLELFQSGFLLLGGSLSSVIGYYFGSGSAQQSEEKAANARLELEAKIAMLNERNDQLENVRSDYNLVAEALKEALSNQADPDSRFEQVDGEFEDVIEHASVEDVARAGDELDTDEDLRGAEVEPETAEEAPGTDADENDPETGPDGGTRN